MTFRTVNFAGIVLLCSVNSASAISFEDLTYAPGDGPGTADPYIVGDLTLYGFDTEWDNSYQGPGISVPTMDALELIPLDEGTIRPGLLFDAAPSSFYTGNGNLALWDTDFNVVSARRISAFSFELRSYAAYDTFGSPGIAFDATFRPDGAPDGTIELIATDVPGESVLSGDLFRDVQAGDEVEIQFDLRLNSGASELSVSSWAVYFTLVPEPSTMGMSIVTAFLGLAAVFASHRRMKRLKGASRGMCLVGPYHRYLSDEL